MALLYYMLYVYIYVDARNAWKMEFFSAGKRDSLEISVGTSSILFFKEARERQHDRQYPPPTPRV